MHMHGEKTNWFPLPQPALQFLRERQSNLLPGGKANAGLYHALAFSYEATPDGRWLVAPDAKANWVSKCFDNKQVGRKEDLKARQQALERLALSLGGWAAEFTLVSETVYVSGLGLPHALENGFSWHPTLGVPYIAGAALKGVTKSWLRQSRQLSKEEEETFRRWFGAGPGPGEDENAHNATVGQWIFFDALPTMPVTLAAEVLTPHYFGWYTKPEVTEDPDTWPGDWQEPHPIPFLVAAKMNVLVMVAPRLGVDGEAEAPRLLEAIEGALAEAGVGAKTTLGFGRFRLSTEGWRHRPRNSTTAITTSPPGLEAQVEAVIAEKRQRNPQQTEISALLEALRENRWQGPQRREVAAMLRERMIKAKKWKERSNHPDKDHDYRRTQQVLRWLAAEDEDGA